MSAQETATSGLGASPPPPWAQRMAPTLYKLGVAKGAEAAGAILLIALGVAWLVFALMLFANKGVGFGTIIYAIVGLALSVWLLRILTDGRKLVIALPMAWLLLFFLAPFLVVFKVSVAEQLIAQPPYSPLLTWADGQLQITAHLSNYQFLLDDPFYVDAYLTSIKIAAISTFLCLLIAYPMAYAIARSSPAWRNTLLMLVILPFWTSFLLRVYAWIGILSNNGVINQFLMWLGVTDQPIVMMQTNFAVYIGIVYSSLPLMILPLYTTLEKLDGTLLEASADLGAGPIKSFLSVTLPLSLPGILAGCLLVFIPAVGEYVIPALLGPSDTLMIGRVLWDEFFTGRAWPVAAAVAIAMLLFLVAPIMWFRNAQGQAEEGR